MVIRRRVMDILPGLSQKRFLDLANAPSVETDGSAASLQYQRLGSVKYPIESTGVPNPVSPYTRYSFNPRANIAEAPSVVGIGGDASAAARSLLPQQAKRPQRRFYRQSRIPEPLNLPPTLPESWMYLQKKIRRFYMQRPLAVLKKNFRVAMRRRRL